MYSPVSSHPTSPFTSLRCSNAQTAPHTHSRNNSIKSTSTASQIPNEPTRVPSSKKLSLTYQTAQFRQQKTLPSQEEQQRGKAAGDLQMKARTVTLQNNEKAQSLGQEGRSISQQSLMMYFQQKMENLKREYLHSLQEYEGRIDQLQAQLRHNAVELKNKEARIGRLEAALQEARRQEKVKPQQFDRHSQLKIEDLEKKIRLLANYAEESSQQTREKCDKLTKKVISCFGSRLTALRTTQSDFAKKALAKLSELQHKLQQRLKQAKPELSITTRGSIQSAQEIPQPKYEQGVSFWDDCFFYPGQRSQNCILVAEMSSRRSQPLNCWLDQEGFMRYCDSGSFLFNRRGEKMRVSHEQLQWLVEHNMLRVF